jgi:hypothetical protein
VGGVPIASVEYANYIVVNSGKRLVESDEAALVVELARVS